MYTCGLAWRSPIRPILGFWESKLHKNVRFSALDADEPPKNLAMLGGKFVTVQTHTNKSLRQ